MSMRAIDISSWQGVVNMKAVRNSGIERVILRAGWGKNNTDPKFGDNATAMNNLGVQGGIYWFSYALSPVDAANEGGYAVAHARRFWQQCMIAYDFEYDSVNYCRKNNVDIDRIKATNFAIAFLTVVRDAGYIPVLYLNEDYWRNWLNVDVIRKSIPELQIWYAYWSSKLPAGKEVMIWQYSSKGKVDGIKGNVDMDEWFGGDSKPADVPTVPNINIKTFQEAANADGYAEPLLVVDGIDGPKTQAARKKIALHARLVDDRYEVGSRGAVVTWLQTRLTEMGYSVGGIDGLFGKKTRDATIAFQKKANLAVDGIAGYNTLQMLFYV